MCVDNRLFNAVVIKIDVNITHNSPINFAPCALSFRRGEFVYCILFRNKKWHKFRYAISRLESPFYIIALTLLFFA